MTSQNDWIENARMIVESARGIVPPDGDLTRIRRARFEGSGFDRETMRRIGELGWFSMWVAEAEGGLGLGLRETCELMRILGRGLVPEPVLSAMTGCALLQSATPESALSGDEVIVAAWQDRTGALDWNGGAERGRLVGEKVHVTGAEDADYLAVTTADGAALVRTDGPGIEITPTLRLDGTTTATVRFHDVEPEAWRPADVTRILEDAMLAHSAYLLGLSERSFELTLDHLRTREQFGRPIGSFQALQHRATELKIQLELSRAGIFATARRYDEGAGAERRRRDASRCKIRATDLCMLVAREAVQMHGAMGITDEADIGLFVRKAMTHANHFGSAGRHRAILAELSDEVAA